MSATSDSQTKIRDYHNLLAMVSNTLYAVRHQTNLTYDERIKAVDYAQKMLPEIRRYLLYFKNTVIK